MFSQLLLFSSVSSKVLIQTVKILVPTRTGKEVLLCCLLALWMAEGHLPQLCRALAASPLRRCTALFSVRGSGQWAHCHPAGISAGIMAE